MPKVTRICDNNVSLCRLNEFQYIKSLRYGTPYLQETMMSVQIIQACVTLMRCVVITVELIDVTVAVLEP